MDLIVLEYIKRKCYIANDDELTILRLEDIVKSGILTVKRMLGLPNYFSFSDEENFEELEFLACYCWYCWNDAKHEFKDNYLDDILSLRSKHGVLFDAEEEN